MNSSDKDSAPQRREERRRIILYISGVGTGMGAELIVSVGIGLFLGSWMDNHFGIKPYGTLLSVLVFLGASLAHILITILQMQKKLEKLRRPGDKEDT